MNSPKQAYTQHWIKAIDETTQDFKRAFGKLSARELNWKPSAEQWSIAQCIDHIIAINQSYFPILDALRAGTYKAPWHGRFSFFTRFFGHFILQSVQPDRKRKSRTFPIWEPDQSELPADILSRFYKHQEEMKKRIQESEDLVASRKVITSPASRTVVYQLGMAFEIMVSHEKRHFQQAWEVLDLKKKAQ